MRSSVDRQAASPRHRRPAADELQALRRTTARSEGNGSSSARPISLKSWPCGRRRGSNRRWLSTTHSRRCVVRATHVELRRAGSNLPSGSLQTYRKWSAKNVLSPADRGDRSAMTSAQSSRSNAARGATFEPAVGGSQSSRGPRAGGDGRLDHAGNSGRQENACGQRQRAASPCTADGPPPPRSRCRRPGKNNAAAASQPDSFAVEKRQHSNKNNHEPPLTRQRREFGGCSGKSPLATRNLFSHAHVVHNVESHRTPRCRLARRQSLPPSGPNLTLQNSSFIYRELPIARSLRANDIITVTVDFKSRFLSEGDG